MIDEVAGRVSRLEAEVSSIMASVDRIETNLSRLADAVAGSTRPNIQNMIGFGGLIATLLGSFYFLIMASVERVDSDLKWLQGQTLRLYEQSQNNAILVAEARAREQAVGEYRDRETQEAIVEALRRLPLTNEG